MENQNQIFKYNGNPITFQIGENTMVNATEMAKPFKKFTKDWLINNQSTEFINSLSVVRGIPLTELVIVNQGGINQGTWMHKDVAIEFARWLSPMFAIWCNDRIFELMKYGFTATDKILGTLLDNIDVFFLLQEGKKCNNR